MDQNCKDIIINIAEIQIEALKIIQKDPQDVDHDLLCKYLQVTEEEILTETQNHIRLYEDVKKYPQLVNTLTEYQLSICQHILFRMEQEWLLTNSEGVYAAWAVLFEADKKFHPEINIIL